jgi:2,3-bisphosphoglycerate-dependent phosphoglycerate mutase
MFQPYSSSASYLIVLLRHGESLGNVEGRYQGQSDFPLTEAGEAQAQALAHRWQKEGVNFDTVISSSLRRAFQTAEIISSILNAPVELDSDWMERNVGVLTGHKPEETAKSHPRPSFITPYMPIGESGESQWELYLRAGRVVNSMLKRPPGRYLVISHGGILNLAIYAILGLTPQADFTGPRFRFGNTGFARLSYTPSEHKWIVLGINDCAHLA